MSRLVILGRSPMVADIRKLLPEYRILNRNTEEICYCEEDERCSYISCIGSPKSYLSKVKSLEETSVLGKWCDIDLGSGMIYFDGRGNLIFPFVYISPSVRIGKHCLIMPNSTVHHDSELGDGTNIASGVTINGGVKIDGNCFIGAGSVIKEGVSICKNVLIGADSFVNKDIDTTGTYFGSPIKKRY